MDAKKVDLGAFEGGGADTQGDRHARNEGEEFTRFGSAHTNVPFFPPTRGLEGPGTVKQFAIRRIWRDRGLPIEE